MEAFVNLGVRSDIIKGIAALGFMEPTPIQTRIIPLMLEKKVDMVGLAQTGTGKTAAFGIPLIQLTAVDDRRTQALVLCPTRELCVQVTKDLMAYARYVRGLTVMAVYGGASIEQQIKALRRGAQIIVATPGRLNDLIRRRKVDVAGIDSVVLDEADEMLQMGFQEELNAILDQVPAQRRMLLFSATMPRSVADIANTYMQDPVEITIGQRNAGAENVRHIFYVAQARDRYEVLKRLIDSSPRMYAIIFCRTRVETQELADSLDKEGYSVDALHGDLSQSQRDLVMQRFRRRGTRLLLATDVAARGLDVNDLTHVVHYNLPDDIAGYTHRSGRTGRAGKSGVSAAIIHVREKHKIKAIEQKLNVRFEQSRIPGGVEILESKATDLIETLRDASANTDGIEASFWERLAESLPDLDRVDLLKRFAAVSFGRSAQHYRSAPDLNIPERRSTSARQAEPAARRRSQTPLFTRFLLNVGKKDGLHASRLIGEINERAGSSRIRIGKIEILNTSAMLEAESRYTAKLLGAFENRMINGKPVSIRVAPAEKQSSGKKSRDAHRNGDVDQRNGHPGKRNRKK